MSPTSKEKEIKTGTLACKLFGHKFHAERLEYHPHYLKLVESGLAGVATSYDMHLVGFKSDYCVRCGINYPSHDLSTQ